MRSINITIKDERNKEKLYRNESLRIIQYHYQWENNAYKSRTKPSGGGQELYKSDLD